jgi:hypothetical protein
LLLHIPHLYQQIQKLHLQQSSSHYCSFTVSKSTEAAWNRAAALFAPLLFQKVQKLQLEQSSNHYCSFTVSKSTEASVGTEQQPLLFLYCFKKYRSFTCNRAEAIIVPVLFQKVQKLLLEQSSRHCSLSKQELNLYMEQRSSLCQILQELHLE